MITRSRILPLLIFISLLLPGLSFSQLNWINVDSLYQPLPASVHVYFTNERIDTGSFRAFYVIAELKSRKLLFTVDTTLNRRLTPSAFYEKNKNPLVVVNCTFFSFATNRNLNTVIKDGKLVSYNVHTVAGRGKDTFTYRHPFASAIGITSQRAKKRRADVAWVFTDSAEKIPYALVRILPPKKDSSNSFHMDSVVKYVYPPPEPFQGYVFNWYKWKMTTAVGGGPVLLQEGQINITNNQELKFAGKAIDDKHPRTAIGYTLDGKLIILAVQGRSESGGGATLTQEARILKDLGCWEALNLDGGGSSCLLVNGKETIKPSDKEGQRPVPAVFLIKTK